ncbi:MAG: alpha/beta hydrolase fold domain-containing protein [Planctomycetota bacterium]
MPTRQKTVRAGIVALLVSFLPGLSNDAECHVLNDAECHVLAGGGKAVEVSNSELVPTDASAQRRRSGRNQDTNNNRSQPTMSTEELLKLTPAGVIVVPDIAYRQGNDAWKLDLAMPKERSDAPCPAIIYIHGGGWTKGDKRGKGIGSVLDYAAKGFVSISVNYRLDVDKKACIEDVKCATRWLRAHAGQYNVDPNRIGAAGNSAGGHLALMLAVCPASAGLEGDGPYREYSSMVQAAHCSSTPIMPGFRGSRGKAIDPDVSKIQPMTYVSGDVPPLYFIHGTEDTRKILHTSATTTARATAPMSSTSRRLAPRAKHSWRGRCGRKVIKTVSEEANPGNRRLLSLTGILISALVGFLC